MDVEALRTVDLRTLNCRIMVIAVAVVVKEAHVDRMNGYPYGCGNVVKQWWK